MSHEQTRDNHFKRLNAYRQSAEYAEYAKAIGAEPPQGDLPSLLGNRWQIDAEIYHEFLEMLPPLGWRGNTFYMSEFTFDDITTRFSREGDRYFCEFARYPAKAHVPTETPWGPSQSAREIAPGITFYTTASHGGFHLSDERLAEMPKPLRDFIPFGGPQAGPGRWFEEDCDWSVVALAFPQFFKPDEITTALTTLKGYKPQLYEQMAGITPKPEFKEGQFVTFPSGMGGVFSARVAAANADGTYKLQVLNADFEDYDAPRIAADSITPMDAKQERYWREKEAERKDPHRARR